MLRSKRLTAYLLILIFAMTLPTVGCTKEKAEAVKTAAEQFRLEANAAVSLAGDLIKKSVDMPTLTTDEELNEIVDDFNAKPNRNTVDVRKFIDGVLQEGSENRVVNQAIDAEYRKLTDENDIFASMFRSLPRGHLFAKDAVAKAERHAIRLTTRFVVMASMIQKNPLAGMNAADRTLLIVKLHGAQSIQDPVKKNQTLLLIGKDIILLRDKERKAKEAAIVQCYKAAESGKTITELIHNYGNFSVGDMLDMIKDSLAILNSITGGANADIKALQSRYESFVKNKIQTDPVWSDALGSDFSALGF